ncbi:MAG: hypothetical protein L0I76_23070 [Pseudonocardia sp.]|nr:hypothetical protein [Pseudonocardia sp.]
MSSTTPGRIPADVLEALLASFIGNHARHLVNTWRREGRTGGFAHPGDSFGRVLAWAWDTNPDRAVALIAEFLNEVNSLADNYGLAPALSLDELLYGIDAALLPGFTGDAALIARARREVPALVAEPLI